MNKVEVSLKDTGHSITLNGKELRGNSTVICDEDDNVKRLRKSGLIVTKPYEEVAVAPPPTDTGKSEPPVQNKTGNNRKVSTMRT